MSIFVLDHAAMEPFIIPRQTAILIATKDHVQNVSTSTRHLK